MITKQMVDSNGFYFYEFPKAYINFYSERKCIDLVRAIQETGNIEMESKGYLLLKNMLEHIGIPITKDSLTHGWIKGKKVELKLERNHIKDVYEIHFNIGPKDDILECSHKNPAL